MILCSLEIKLSCVTSNLLELIGQTPASSQNNNFIATLRIRFCADLQPNDIAMMSDMAKYLNNQDDANDGRHNPIPHLFWWAWNPNSADTGGLVSDPNWDTVTVPHFPHCRATAHDNCIMKYGHVRTPAFFSPACSDCLKSETEA